jgi:NitT/TauT family transport system substrate-binding protein
MARFYTLRLRKVGMIKSSPQRMIAQGIARRFLNELEQELKGEAGRPGKEPACSA